MLVDLNLTGGFYKSRSLPLSAQVTRNWYPEVQEKGNAKSPFVLMPFPGSTFFGSDSDIDAGQSQVIFDGTNDYLKKDTDLTGNADGKVFTFACRFKYTKKVGVSTIFSAGGQNSGTGQSLRFSVDIDDNDLMSVAAWNSSNTLILNNIGDTTLSGDTWYDLLISADLENGTEAQIYIDDAAETIDNDDFTDDTIDFTTSPWLVGARWNDQTDVAFDLLNGGIAFLWFDNTEALDFSVESNRRKFFTAGGAIADLGDDGSTPTGSAPIVYLNGDSDEFATNKGTGGGFTEVGALADESVTSGADRGHFYHDGVLYHVAGTTLWSVSSSGVHTSLGTITGSGQCIFEGIGSSVVVVSEGKAYVWDGSTLTEVTDPDLETPNGAAHINNQIIYDGDDGRFASSDVGDGTAIDSLNYATAEVNADDLVRPYVIPGGEILYLLGDKVTEQWWNSGQGSPPFNRVSGGTLPMGLKATYSVADNGSSMYFLGHDLRVYHVQGSNYRYISTIPLFNEISHYTDPTDAIGSYFTFQNQGFYVLNFPTDEKTWCFHEESGEWFEICSGVTGGRVIYNRIINAYGKIIGSDYRNGNLYELSDLVYSENGSVIQRVRDTAPLHGGLLGAPGKWVEMNSLELIMETGVGDLTDTPEIILTWSDDGGRTWSTEAWGTLNIGTAGQYQKKIEWFSLGGFYQRILRFKATEAVRYSIYSAKAELEIGM